MKESLPLPKGDNSVKRALLSVSDKTGLIDFAQGLVQYGYDLISTGGTAKALQDAGLAVTTVDEVTGFPEILDGRVKTLHPRVHAGLLAKDTPVHMNVLKEMDIAPIDLVVVNLYPFQATVAKQDVSLEDAIENIDIGGPSMIRAAAKNHERVTVVVDPRSYETVLRALQNDALDLALRRRLAFKAYTHTAQYDAAISDWLREAFEEPLLSDEFALGGHKVLDLRYGENAHQEAAFYATDVKPGTVAGAKQLAGKALSYNNLVDLDAAWQLVQEWDSTKAACAIIKHTNPCGTALGKNAKEAYVRALAADPVSAFGGIIACNQVVDADMASEVIQTFMEAVIAPSFTDEAVAIFSAKPNLRLLATGSLGVAEEPWVEKISGGFLVQERDHHHLERSDCRCVSDREPTDAEWDDMLFAWQVVKHVKSNAIVVAKDEQTLGVGAGQMNRVGSCDIAFAQAADKAKGAALASDAFFPFRDSIDAAAKAGITAIIQPGGSIRDEESIAAANEAGIAMVFTGVRHFKH